MLDRVCRLLAWPCDRRTASLPGACRCMEPDRGGCCSLGRGGGNAAGCTGQVADARKRRSVWLGRGRSMRTPESRSGAEARGSGGSRSCACRSAGHASRLGRLGTRAHRDHRRRAQIQVRAAERPSSSRRPAGRPHELPDYAEWRWNAMHVRFVSVCPELLRLLVCEAVKL